MAARRDTSSSVLSRYFSEIRDFPLLTKEEEKQLARDLQNGRSEAVNELVESNLSFVAKVASEYRNLVTGHHMVQSVGRTGVCLLTGQCRG